VRIDLIHGRKLLASSLHLPNPPSTNHPQPPNSGATPVLIASTVVEVGIDEPEASVMLVENANCFGMAQLHQLRGRVGRGARESRCFLMAPADNLEAVERLSVMERSHNGLHIAEADLRMRCVVVLYWGVLGAALVEAEDSQALEQQPSNQPMK